MPDAPAAADPSCGYLFAVTGEGYLALANRAAAMLARVSPGYPIDLYTDLPDRADRSVFDRVHEVPGDWHRPKIPALRDTRFERAICIDADTFPVADPADVFELLTRFDVAGAHDNFRNRPLRLTVYKRPVPAAFPQINSGVLGIRKSAETQAFLQQWYDAMIADGQERDQPSLRELLYYSDLRVAILPIEYNLMAFREMRQWHWGYPAPRILHHPDLHKHFSSDGRRIATPDDLLGGPLARWMRRLIDNDRTLDASAPVRIFPPFSESGPAARAYARARRIAVRFARR